MNFSQIQAEFFAHGFDYLNDNATGLVRAKQWINFAYQELCDLEDWPFLEATATGAAPLVISDLGRVESVIDTTNKNKLDPIDRRSLTDGYPDQTVLGTPSWYFLTAGTTINVFPVNTTVSLTVRYFKSPADLSNAGDTPAIPTAFHDAIVLGAVRRGLVDDSNAADYQLVVAEWQRYTDQMRSQLLSLQADRPDVFQVITGVSEDW